MKIFFKTRAKARAFAASRKANSYKATVLDKGQVTHDVTGSRYAVNLTPDTVTIPIKRVA